MCEFSVTAINTYVKSVIDGHDNFKEAINVVGEITGYTPKNSTGYVLFYLKDKESKIKCALWSEARKNLKFNPTQGLQVSVKACVGFYKGEGVCQLNILEMRPIGEGAEELALKQLKENLQKEGLFDTKYKKDIPKYPKKIGVITSDSGDAIHDITSTIEQRWCLAEIIVSPCNVQGVRAAQTMVDSINALENYGGVDVIILGRGGGSVDSLKAYNDEKLARAIFACKIPIISAVGHTLNNSISDFVADKNFITPTEAAEKTVPNKEAELKYLSNMLETLNRIHGRKLDFCKYRLEASSNIAQKVDVKFAFMEKNITTFAIDLDTKKFITVLEAKENKVDRLSEILKFNGENALNAKEHAMDIISKDIKTLVNTPATKEVQIVEARKNLLKSTAILNEKEKNVIDFSKNLKVLEDVPQAKENHFDMLNREFKNTSGNLLQTKENVFLKLNAVLSVLSPYNVLKRGFTMLEDEDEVISSVKQIEKDSILSATLADGKIKLKVLEVKGN